MNERYRDGLSIVIPSYNRKEQLLRLLTSVFHEDLSGVFEIIIVDNDSDYDIHEIILKFSSSEKLRVIKNPFNIQMSTNMMSTFTYCKTKWMWLISDDDIVCKGAIKNIIQKISSNPNVSLLKFSTEGIGAMGVEKNERIESLKEFIDYYEKDKPIRRGNLVFVSNGVYNIEILHPFLGKGFEYSYTYIPFLIPVFFGLEENIPMRYFDECIIKYNNPGSGFWSLGKIGLGLSTISHISLNIEKKDFKRFLNIVMLISYRALFSDLITGNVKNSMKIFILIYSNSYRYYLKFYQKIICLVMVSVFIIPGAKWFLKKYVYKV
jgi:glycosyltransferase involved in cell wall biosynthesis